MASPVGHTLMGLSLYFAFVPWQASDPRSRLWKAVAFCVVCANLPDIDFALGFLAYNNVHALHSRGTHSAVFLLAASLLCTPWCPALLRWHSKWGLTFVVLGSHHFMDMLSAQTLGFHQGYGILWWYPFSQERFAAPFALFYGIRHHGLAQVLSIANLRALLYELCVLGTLLAVILHVRGRSRT